MARTFQNGMSLSFSGVRVVSLRGNRGKPILAPKKTLSELNTWSDPGNPDYVIGLGSGALSYLRRSDLSAARERLLRSSLPYLHVHPMLPSIARRVATPGVAATIKRGISVQVTIQRCFQWVVMDSHGRCCSVAAPWLSRGEKGRRC